MEHRKITVWQAAKFSYQEYEYGCYMDGMEDKPGQGPTRLGYVWAAIKWKWYVFVWAWVLQEVCKRKGHKWELTDTGGPENGPCIYADCIRCGHSEGPSYHG